MNSEMLASYLVGIAISAPLSLAINFVISGPAAGIIALAVSIPLASVLLDQGKAGR